MCIEQTTSLLLLILIAPINSWINTFSYFSEASSQAACNKKDNREHYIPYMGLDIVGLGGFGLDGTDSVNVVCFPFSPAISKPKSAVDRI